MGSILQEHSALEAKVCEMESSNTLLIGQLEAEREGNNLTVQASSGAMLSLKDALQEMASSHREAARDRVR